MAHSAQTFRELADERLTEAQLLLANDRPSGAYYLAGYAIEFALKAKIATRFLANEIPDKVLVIKVHDHDFNKLLQLANLGDEDYATLNTDTELRRLVDYRREVEAGLALQNLEFERSDRSRGGGGRGPRINAMAAESLIAHKLDASIELAKKLRAEGSPLLAAFWDYDSEAERWKLILVPASLDHERDLVRDAVNWLVQPPFRSAFSLADPTVDNRQIDRARALGSYIRHEPYVGRRMDTTFTGGQYFESVIPVYLAPELMTHLSPA
ncbi:MAG: hypothetical protein JWR73_3204 [Tardiphaga sp.]|nr:hypothetical protein [Tardiphaga sp.]MDB5627402.1 hypothetical protein [Tardiphaga sp.]